MNGLPAMTRRYEQGGNMKRKRLLYILTAVIVLVFSSVSLAAVPIEVTAGKETILKLKNVSKRVSLANVETADVRLISPTEIVINGKKPGVTSLIVWDEEGKTTFFDVVVTAQGMKEEMKLETLEQYIKEIVPNSDIRAERQGDTLILRGTTKNRFTCKKDKQPVVSRRDEKQLIDIIESEEKDTCVQAISRIEQVAGVYFPGIKILNLVTVPEAEQVVLEVKVAQIDKTKLKELGLSILSKGSSAEGTAPGLVASPGGTLGSALSTTTVVTGGTATVGSTTATAGIGPGLTGFDMNTLTPQIGIAHFKSGLAAFIKALAEKGYAKILAEPNLTVRSGESGKFLVGTRVPIQQVTGVGTAQTVSVVFEEVGIKLNFKPEVLESGAVRLMIDPAEVSNISGFLTFSGIVAPQIDTRQVSTSVDLEEGESLILAGLLSEDMKKNIQKIPLLGDIPILGALFRSTRDELVKKDLAFFITPKLVRPIAPGVRPELPGDKPLTPNEERQFDWIPLPAKSE
jgi:pilus assembly protein CpaC